MQTCRRVLEPDYSGREMHRSASFYHYQRRIEFLDRRPHSLSSDPHGLGLTYHERPESHLNGHLPTRNIVCHVAFLHRVPCDQG